MKIYIVRTVGSGKSTLARKLSEKNSMRVFHLDNIVHEGERNRTDKEVFESLSVFLRMSVLSLKIHYANDLFHC
ncbi:adenylate kinase family enzyme [Lactococcus lactis]